MEAGFWLSYLGGATKRAHTCVGHNPGPQSQPTVTGMGIRGSVSSTETAITKQIQTHPGRAGAARNTPEERAVATGRGEETHRDGNVRDGH